MKVQARQCDARRIADFLDGRLSEPEQAVLEEHLSDCAACRASLGAQTADDEVWDKASRYLRDEDDELESLSGTGDSAAECDQTYSIQHVLDALGPTDDPAMLGRLGAYEISGVVGSGGMGVVLKALDRSLDRTVAIKVMAPHLATNGAARKRFAREAKAAAAVLHPNVMAIHSVSSGDSLPFLVMPYLRGTSLQKRLDAEGPLPVGEILRIAAQTAAGLAAAHAQGLIHRDIKPANILLEEGVERVAITDFGLARAVDDASMTRTGVVAGTPQYMSPEQARGEPLGQSSDLFSLGSVLYAMSTGRPPFRAESSYGVLRRITDDEPKSIREINPDIPEWLCLLISRLMAKSPDARFGNALEVAALLEQCLAHVQQPMSVPLPASLMPRAAGRRSIFNVTRKGVLAMLGTIGMTLLGMVLWQATEAPDISGQWTSDEWGTVVLEAKRSGEYEGSYTGSSKGQPAAGDGSAGSGFGDTILPGGGGMMPGTSLGKGKSGTLQLKWSRVECRFNGTWRTGENRNGKMSLRLVENEIRGAWTTAKDAQKESGTPRLADLLWKRKQESVSKAMKPPTKTEAEESEQESRIYDIHDLPIWDREGRTQQTDLLCHYLGLDTDRTKALYVPFGSYDASRMMLRVRASSAKHLQVARLLADLRTRSGPPAMQLTKRESLRVYAIADLPLWSRDGKQQNLNLLMHFLRSTIDPPSWESQTTRAAYDAEKLRLVVQATPEVHNRIAAVLARPLPDPVVADSASIVACIGPKAPVRLGAIIAHEDIHKGLDPTLMYLHVWDWTKSDVSHVMLIQKSELGVLAPDGRTTLTYEGEVLHVGTQDRRQYSGFEVSDDQVITSLRFSPSGKYVAAMIRPRTPHASDRKDAPPVVGSTLRLLELDAATNTGKQIGEFPANANAGAAFSTDETSVIYSSDKHGIIRRDATHGNILNEYQPGLRSLSGAVGISASPNGRFVAVADYDGSIYVWETQSGRLLVTHQGLVDAANTDFQAKAMRFSPDGAHVALVSGNRLQVMETATGKIVKNHGHESTPAFAQVRWSQDGKTITLLTYFQPTNFVDKDGVASHPTANIFPRVFEWNWREGSPVLKQFTDGPQQQAKVDAEKVPGIEAALDRKNARSVAEAYVAAAIAGRMDQAASFAKGNPAEHKQIASLTKFNNRLAMKSVYVNDPTKPTTALATSEAMKLKEAQPDGQRDGFLVLTLTMSEEGWFVTDIDFESEESAEGELNRFLDTNPKAAGVPPLNATLLPGTNSDSRTRPQATGKQLGTVLGKPIREGDLNKNVSTEDNLKRLLLLPLTEHYCRQHKLDRDEELQTKFRDEKRRAMARLFVLPAELNRHLYEKHGGRVIMSPFGAVAFDGMKMWLEEREKAGDFEITDPELKATFHKHWIQEPAGAQFASPDQIKGAFDPTVTDRFIENYAKIPAGAHRDPAVKLVGVVFSRPIYLQDRYFTNKAELPLLLYTLVVPELEESYRKEHSEVVPTDAEITGMAARKKTEYIQSFGEQRKSLELVLAKQKKVDPASKGDPKTLAAIQEVDDILKRVQENDGRDQAEDMMRQLKFQEHIFNNHGGGRGLTGSQGLILLDAQKRWVEERERLGEFQIADDQLRQTLYDYWTNGPHHRGARLIEDAEVRANFNFGLRGELPSNSRPNARTADSDKARKTIDPSPTNAIAASQKFPLDKVTGFVASIRKKTEVAEAVDGLRKITGLDFGDGVDRESRQAWLKWWEQETSSIDNAKDGVREFIVTGKITDQDGKPISGANVRAHVPLKSSPSGQYQLAETLSDSSGRYVMALGIPPFATPEESTWKLSFTVRNPPRFVADQLPVTMTLHRNKAEGAGSTLGEAPLEKTNDAIFVGHPVKLNFKLRPASIPTTPDSEASPKPEPPAPQKPEDKSPKETSDANNAQSGTKPDRGPTTQFAIGNVSYSLPFNFPSVESILGSMPDAKACPKNERIQCELMKCQVSNAWHYPLVGPAQLVQAHFKSTLTSDAGREVVYSDNSHLIRAQPE